MICADCRQGTHEVCREGTWCDCQHRPGTSQPVPVAGDKYNGFSLVAYDAEGQDCDVVLSRGDEVIKRFPYPKYRVWTLLAHWRESDEVNP